jgi:hypothetical protein
MHVVQFLLPLTDAQGQRFPSVHFEQIRDELAARFGGVTAFTQSPAQGMWKSQPHHDLESDEVILFEVMTDSLDSPWWAAYRTQLEQVFRQKEVMVRTWVATRL